MTLALDSTPTFSPFSDAGGGSRLQSSEPQSGVSETEVLIVDDHPAILEAVSSAIEKEEGMHVLESLADADEVQSFLKEHAPDVFILDISPGNKDGFSLIETARAARPEMKVLVYSIHDEELYAARALRAGAVGYVHKSAPTESVIEAIHQIEQGEVSFSPEITAQILGEAIRDRNYGATPEKRLTDRELTVFRRIGEGKSVQEITDELDLSHKTVETYRRRAKEKLGYKTVDELHQFAVQWTSKQSNGQG